MVANDVVQSNQNRRNKVSLRAMILAESCRSRQITSQRIRNDVTKRMQ